MFKLYIIKKKEVIFLKYKKFIFVLQDNEPDDNITENIIISLPENLNLTIAQILNCSDIQGDLFEKFLNKKYIRTAYMVHFNLCSIPKLYLKCTILKIKFHCIISFTNAINIMYIYIQITEDLANNIFLSILSQLKGFRKDYSVVYMRRWMIYHLITHVDRLYVRNCNIINI